MNRDQGGRFADVSAPPLMELLEERRMLSHAAAPLPYVITRHHGLVIQGSRNGTSLVVTTSGRHGEFLNVTINGKTFQFHSGDIRRIVFQEHSRRDHARVPRRFPVVCEIIGYDGSDQLVSDGGSDTSGGGDTGGGDSPTIPAPTPPIDSGGASNGGDSGGSPTPPDPGASDGGQGFEGTGSDFPSGDDDDDSLSESASVVARAPSFAGVFRG